LYNGGGEGIFSTHPPTVITLSTLAAWTTVLTLLATLVLAWLALAWLALYPAPRLRKKHLA
jgi:hypothetical protein